MRAMCSRFLLSSTPDKIATLFRVAGPLVNTEPHYNVAPMQTVLAIMCEKPMESRVFAMLRWGLVPRWAKDARIATKLINARGETIADKPSFRDAYRRRRCVIPVDGFYEWTRDARHQPFAVAKKDRTPFGLAGLWEEWTDPASGERVRSCTIVTTAANAACAAIHDRMPVIVAFDDLARWLGETPASASEVAALLRPYPANDLDVFPVAKRVGNVRHDDPALIAPIALPAGAEAAKYSPRLL
jgi:putative SOS response-associated peptidase YedK